MCRVCKKLNKHSLKLTLGPWKWAIPKRKNFHPPTIHVQVPFWVFQGVEIWLASAQFADSQVSTPSFSLYVWAVRDPGSPKFAQLHSSHGNTRLEHCGDLNSSKWVLNQKIGGGFYPPKSSILGGKIPLFFGFNTQILGPWGDENAGDELVFGRLQVRFVGFFGISESWRFLPSKKPVKQYLNKKLHLDLTNVMKGCWTKNSGILPPKMDGLFHGKPLFFNGWFGGIKSPLFVVQHPYGSDRLGL